MARTGGERAGGGGTESTHAMDHQVYDVALPALEVLGVVEGNADGRGDGAGVDEWKPAEGDHAEEQLRGVAGGSVVETEFVADQIGRAHV